MSFIRTLWEYIDLLFVAIIIGYIFYSGLGSFVFHWMTGTLPAQQWPSISPPKTDVPSLSPTQIAPPTSTPPVAQPAISQSPPATPPTGTPPSASPAKHKRPATPATPTPLPVSEQPPPTPIPLPAPTTQTPAPEVMPTPEITSQPTQQITPTPEPTQIHKPMIPPISVPSAPQLIKPIIDMQRLEKKVFDLINDERNRNGRKALQWNEGIANVARLHSRYLATFNIGLSNSYYLNHVDATGTYQDSRLHKGGIHYFDMSAENLHVNSIVKKYLADGKNTPVEYNTEEELAQKADTGWMNSPGHRQNIMTGEYDESGLGIAADSTGTNYIYTQIFIHRALCGYETGSCCEKRGFLPYCFVPLQCNNMMCE